MYFIMLLFTFPWSKLGHHALIVHLHMYVLYYLKLTFGMAWPDLYIRT